ncbi:lycopene cyclase domain-containing protein [Paramicrobacterium fandaimingii]|uniref:lycopene cyclase domain-containing protein n=1 Tax=Paramicrobacterium fandaimingii TaxID=2708079 RepID=UPI00141EA570|nr:lycopene cyclase domain-containing protein [Microbacterium fandaimingii]
MTYALMSLPFEVAAVVIFAVGMRRSHHRGGLRGLLADAAVTAVALMILTIVFDNIMIAAGLFDYGAQQIVGLRIGLMPVEDLLYPLVGTLLIAGLREITRARIEGTQHAEDS